MAADRMDRYGNKVAKDLIAAIKIVAPSMALKVLDRCMQVHGAAGLTADFFMAEAYNYARQVRIADGPDQVHMMALGREMLGRYGT
jgi:acyl-CoA dehydrogenase